MGAGLYGLNGLNQEVSTKIWLTYISPRNFKWPWNSIPPTVWCKQYWIVLQKLSKANLESTKPYCKRGSFPSSWSWKILIFSHTNGYKIESSLCLLIIHLFTYYIITVGKIYSTSLPIPHRCLCGINVAIYSIPNYRIRSVFYLRDVGLCNSDSKFQTSIAPLLLNELAIVGMRFLSWNKRNILVPKLFDVVDFFISSYTSDSSSYTSDSFMFKQRGKVFGDVVWEKESIIDVQCRQENPNSQIHRSSGKRGKLERWTFGWDFPVSIEYEWWILFVWYARKDL